MTDFKESEMERNIISLNTVTYIAGYLLKKCLAKHSCNVCHNVLAVKQIDECNQLFCLSKSYESLKNGLTVPHNAFVNYVLELENIFVAQFSGSTQKAKIGRYLCSLMPALPNSVVKCQSFPSMYLVQLFVKMRLHYALKFGNQERTSKKKKSRKYVKVQHL